MEGIELAKSDRALVVEIKVLDQRVREWGLPRYQSEMAAAVDLFACVDAPVALHPESAARLIPSGISVFIGDPLVAAVVVPRSGLGHRTGLVLGNLVGVLDADYLGPLMVSAWNRNPAGTDPIVVQPGDRIAQMMFVPILRPSFAVVEEFSRQTTRGAGGFGSTGLVSGEAADGDHGSGTKTRWPRGEG
jgi:dUTP diphosphatase